MQIYANIFHRSCISITRPCDFFCTDYPGRQNCASSCVPRGKTAEETRNQVIALSLFRAFSTTKQRIPFALEEAVAKQQRPTIHLDSRSSQTE